LTFSICQNGNVALLSQTSIPYNTINLKKGYQLIFATTDKSQILRLIGPTVDTVLKTINIKASYKNLGTLGADLGDDFAIVYDVSTFPSVEIFNKEKGEIIITGISLDVDTINDRVFYIDLKNQRKLGLFDAKTKNIELFNPIHTHCLWWFECIISKSLTDKDLTIDYVGLNNYKERKIYVR
jgi:hypothetical protein